MGDNPFTNCPKLELINKSRNFIMEDGALYDKKMRLIYYSIKYAAREFHVPDGVISIGKHAFYNCKKLEKIIIPPSVRIIENNPFSNCPLLTLENHSPNFILKDGALYNKTMTTLFYYDLSNKSQSLIIPEGVNIIGRHSFYNCRYLKTLTIPSSVKIIGYNPFTNCQSLSLINRSPNFSYEEGVLYNKKKTELIYYSISNPADTLSIPDIVRRIGRNAFFGCANLKHITLPEGLESIERSAFANCRNLTTINIPRSVASIGEWAFYNCKKLIEVNIPDHTSVESYTFYGCKAKINRIKKLPCEGTT